MNLFLAYCSYFLFIYFINSIYLILILCALTGFIFIFFVKHFVTLLGEENYYY